MKADFSLTKFNINDFSEELYSAAFNAMSHERQEECLRYRQKSDRMLCVAADMLARRAVAVKCGTAAENVRICKDENGKPYVKDLPVFFNVSHSGDYAVCAVHSKNIGVDIERIRQVKINTVRFFCSPDDIMYIFGTPLYSRLSPDELTDDILERYFEVWTFKEAYFKRSGMGMGKFAADVSFLGHEKYIEKFGGYVICVCADE